ncbi:ADP-ribosylglycohydrolase family protein [Streptomyces sp. 3MP-14]|uniref:ADP-ribosylglycohydrolase family protein n=1 Tax=Streptomyces mimosae TaxID=2586635 RepID=A0A5N5ZZF1_9ACTN|nr:MULTISPECIES: ADP-ribosylglycohydrolase family protein [Streptomyces]KAB8161312.1 ADP-ribosylglycohydrolase family protein [Streptomyces mimosae]KAB8173114.1 ADP-ribosylglycohydrolase family protein [Streptomyces sp. 3MP-14]
MTGPNSPTAPARSALRLTWVQPEDLVGHELAQAALDGRDAAAVERRWLAAGGHRAPERAGASPEPATPALRRLAEELLDELAALPAPLAEREPTSLAAIRAACPDWPAPPARSEPPDVRRLEAAWLGRAAGCVLGKPVEKLPLAAIRALARAAGNWPLNDWFTARGVPAELLAAHPWNRRSAPASLAENIAGAPEDDDLNYPLLNLLLLRRHGTDFTTADVAALWLDELPAGRTFTAERVAYRNLLAGFEPPATATHRNPFREWIGAQIRADVFGWTHPGDPGRAAELAHREAVLTHTGNGVYGAMFVAAAVATAMTGRQDVHGCLAAGLTVVPARSRYAAAVRLGVETARAHRDFDAAVDALHARFADHHWVHALPNAALLAAALTHADGDFTGSICRAVAAGLDTDSNGATAGSVAGALAGDPDALPRRWTAPLRNQLASSVGDFDGVGFDELADLTRRAAPPPRDATAPASGATAPTPEARR